MPKAKTLGIFLLVRYSRLSLACKYVFGINRLL